MPRPRVKDLFPDDYFVPEIFAISERKYLREHVGDKPSIMERDPPPEGVNIPTLQVALQRLFDDPDVSEEAIKTSIDRSLKLYERKQRVRQMMEDDSIPYHELGVGNGRGQTKIDRSFEVPLTPTSRAPKGVFDDLFEEHELDQITKDPHKIKEMFRVECGFCPEGDRYFHTGSRAAMAVGNHIRQAHEEDAKQWTQLAPLVRRAMSDGELRIVVVTPDGLEYRERPVIEDD